MDEETEEAMTPMVDALTGATAAVLLVSIFLMVSTIAGVSDSLKEYGNNALYKNEQVLNDVLNRKEPSLNFKRNEMSFYKSYKLSDLQINQIRGAFKLKVPIELIIYSNDKDEIITYNMLLFIRDSGLEKYIDSLVITYKKSQKNDGLTYINWKFK